MREHLVAAARVVPQALADLQGPPFPDGTDFAYRVFLALHTVRAHGPSGAFPIAYHELWAYTMLTGDEVTPQDVRLIRIADDVFLEEMATRFRDGASRTESA